MKRASKTHSRHVHERIGATRKVRALKHRRSRAGWDRACYWEKDCASSRAVRRWKHEQRRKGHLRHSSERMPTVTITAPRPWEHFYDPHSPFQFREGNYYINAEF